MRSRFRLCSAAWLVLSTAAPAQRWEEMQGRTESGAVALRQAQLDLASDALVLLVASHPDDRYVLPAVYLRYRLGARVAVLLASRGGGGQNSLGPETGDALERIRTLEAEAGCARLGADVYYLDRPDLGFRRSAAETFAEWGRDETAREMVRLLRTIRPDVVLTTHHAEEAHGHDLALAELLPEVVAKAADASWMPQWPAHRVHALFLGGTSTPSPATVAIATDEFEPLRGATFRRLAYDVLLRCHLSPGLPAPMETMFEAETGFVAVDVFGTPPPRSLLDGVASLFDDGVFPDSPPAAAELRRLTRPPSSGEGVDDAALIASAMDAVRLLEALPCPDGSDAVRRRDRRLEAARRVALHACAIQVEVEAPPGTVAVPGEELDLDLRVNVGGPRGVDRVEVSAPRGEALLEPLEGDSTAIAAGSWLHAAVAYRVPLAEDGSLQARFRGDRFEPPVRLDLRLHLGALTLPVSVVVPVDLRPAAELSVVPRMLLLPNMRGAVRFTVKVERNSTFPVEGELDLRAPAGYRVEGPRTRVKLDASRGDIFEFTLHAPADRRGGVDVVRIGLGGNRVVLPVHKVDVVVDPGLRIGVVRGMDDALSSIIGAGGFGLHWAGLSDIDLAIGELLEFDTIVVDVRALRDRRQARQSFRRLLDFCTHRGKRLVVLYHKDTEFEPPGEGFTGAPFQPFQIGRNRVTRADSPVRVLRPQHCLLNRPNAILPGDWDGWEQERGLYFPVVYADNYEPLLELADPGLPPERSAVLYARSGEGEYVYCALALWRQLKKLHPGSVRLLANLLSPVPPRD
jgi:LmbE family N-acetylglucosaminyl deacetylase